jgi:predicted secreted protein
MFAINQKMKLITLGIVFLITIISASCLLLNSQHQPATCTINQTIGNVIVIDNTMDNAVICSEINNSAILRLGLLERVGAKWQITHSSGLSVSEGILVMPEYPGIGTEEWNITVISPGIQTLKAECKQYINDDRIISTQNLTFIVE